MDLKSRLLRELGAHPEALAGRTCFVGFDGFVDTIVSPVARRDGPGERFSAFAGIADFGSQVTAAAGKSANFELYPRMELPGGNGPIITGALAALGARVTCAGAFGRPEPHPVFAEISRKARLVSLAEPARTTAMEFPDGKLMFGIMRSLDDITPGGIAAAFGGDGYREAVTDADLVVLGNWTMIPHMTEVYADLTANILPAAPGRPGRQFFFDLADPAKRSAADLRGALDAISRFEEFGRVALGLNLKEAQHVLAALGTGACGEAPEDMKAGARTIRIRLGLANVVIHATGSAACATPDGSWWVPGPYTPHPLISTGAGDHFNAGFSAGRLLGLDPESCLGLGVSASGHYVRTARSPGPSDLEAMLR